MEGIVWLVGFCCHCCMCTSRMLSTTILFTALFFIFFTFFCVAQILKPQQNGRLSSSFQNLTWTSGSKKWETCSVLGRWSSTATPVNMYLLENKCQPTEIVCVCVCVCVCVHLCVCMHMYVCVCVHACVCVWVHMHACMYLCLVSVSVLIWIG